MNHDTEGTCSNEIVDVYPGKIYKVTYYDVSKQAYTTVTGTVYNLNKNSIYMKVIKTNKNDCLCTNKDIISGLVDIVNIEIPVFNISSINEVISNSDIPDKPQPPKERTVTVVNVLGISAELIQSVILRLRIYEDGHIGEKAIPVDMKTGNKYHVTYVVHEPQHTVYEIDGILKEIKILPSYHCSVAHTFIREEKPIEDAECIGSNNTIYNNDHFYDLDKVSDIGDRILLVFDTSKDFDSTFDSVMLRDIRMVEDITEKTDDAGNDTEEDDDNPVMKCPYFKQDLCPCCTSILTGVGGDCGAGCDMPLPPPHPMPVPPGYPCNGCSIH